MGRRRRRWCCSPLLLGLCGSLMALAVASSSSSSSSSSCETASTVVKGSSDTQAIAYDSSCTARLFEVLSLSETATSLNLSNLDLASVQSYPSVYTMILNDNQLETFAPQDADNNMQALYLASNRIANLSALELPLRLDYLDLSDNKVTTVPATAAWPAAGLLQTLLLDGNDLEEIESKAFANLDALQALSLSSTGITTLDNVELPASLSTLNATKNSLTSVTSNFSNLPTALENLDLSDNLLTEIPASLPSLTSLLSLNLASNSIRYLTAIALPATLQSLDLSDNPLQMIEVCSSDVSVLQNLATFDVPSTISGSCSNSEATVQSIQGVSVCVLSEAACSSSSSSTDGTATSTSSSSSGSETSGSENILTNASSESDSLFSSEAIGVIGSIAFLLGIVVCTSVFLLYRKRKRDDEKQEARKRRAQTRSRGRSNLLSYARELDERSNTDEDGDFRMSDGDKTGWVFDSPQYELEDKYNPVAILEEDFHLHKRKPGKMDDLLVYEIPPEEITMKRVMANSLHAGKRAPRVLFLAEYQGFNVVVHALLRQKKTKRSEEKRFIEQIRLASTLEHASIVHFIGLTYGCSSGVGGVTALANNDLLPQNWTLGVIFEYMALGSLASMFQAERNRREGKQYYSNGSLSSTIGSGGGNIFSWYPVFSQTNGPPNPNSDWRCKLSIALDVAMGLVYLHSCNVVHGNICSEKVLVNEHGEAKLSALDMLLPSERNHHINADRHNQHHDGGMRESIRQSAKQAMRRVVGLVPTHPTSATPGHAAALTPVTPTFAPAEASPAWMEQKADVYAFGILLWELDTLISIESMKDLAMAGSGGFGSSRVTTKSSIRVAPGQEQQHQLLKFSGDCPSDIQFLARRCWSPELKIRPDAIDIQEELVRVLEGRLTTSSHVPSNWARPTNLSTVSSFSSSNFSARSSDLEMDAASALALSRADI